MCLSFFFFFLFFFLTLYLKFPFHLLISSVLSHSKEFSLSTSFPPTSLPFSFPFIHPILSSSLPIPQTPSSPVASTFPHFQRQSPGVSDSPANNATTYIFHLQDQYFTPSWDRNLLALQGDRKRDKNLIKEERFIGVFIRLLE